MALSLSERAVSLSAFWQQRIRSYPSFASLFANCSPIPELAPVITAYIYHIPYSSINHKLFKVNSIFFFHIIHLFSLSMLINSHTPCTTNLYVSPLVEQVERVTTLSSFVGTMPVSFIDGAAIPLYEFAKCLVRLKAHSILITVITYRFI